MTTQDRNAEDLAVLAAAVADVTGRDAASVRAEDRLRADLDIDSLEFVKMVMTVEEMSGVKIPDEALASAQTVGDILNALAASRDRAADAS